MGMEQPPKGMDRSRRPLDEAAVAVWGRAALVPAAAVHKERGCLVFWNTFLPTPTLSGAI